MRKRLCLCFITSMLLLCSACGVNSDNASSDGSTPPTQAKEKVPSWIQSGQEDGILYQGLNLDGVGESDDDAYVCAYHFGDYEDKITVLFVHLGTGETVAKPISIYGKSNLQTGKLLSENRDAILLEIAIPGSNYGAANLFVLGVETTDNSNDIKRDPVITTFLETNNAILEKGNNVPQTFTNSIADKLTGDFVEGASITNIVENELQGINIYQSGIVEPYTIYWDSEGYCWSIATA